MLRVALAQINPTVGDLKGNARKIADFIAVAEEKQADLVVFPELAICGYPPEDLVLKDYFVQDNIKVLKQVAKQITHCTAVIGFVDKGKGKNIYNAAAVISNGRIKGVYHKQKLPNYGVFDEKRYFSLGENERIYSLNENVFGVNICEDIWVDQGPYKNQVLKGANLLVNISCSPYDIDKLKQRQRLLIKRAKETKTFICYANIVGGQDELVFDGGSCIIDPKGKVIAASKQFDEDMIFADIDFPKKKPIAKAIISIKQKVTQDKEPLFQRKIRRLHNNEAIYQALVSGTRDYVRKNGFKKVVLGLSGGIDSALVAAVAVDAVGEDNVVCVSMPSRYSSKGTQADARKLASNLGVEFKEIPIESIFKSYGGTLKSHFKGQKPNIAEENIQARIRGNILMALSNKFGWLVLTTGNKSEVAVGYCTLYGDMTGGFAVIKDVPKMKVYELSVLRNKTSNNVIPKSIIHRAPSAELKNNQKDQDSLPPYDVLDEILKGYVEEHASYADLSKKAKGVTVKKIIELVDKSEYKRRQGPPGIKITTRAFGKDWRLPITNKYKEF